VSTDRASDSGSAAGVGGTGTGASVVGTGVGGTGTGASVVGTGVGGTGTGASVVGTGVGGTGTGASVVGTGVGGTGTGASVIGKKILSTLLYKLVLITSLVIFSCFASLEYLCEEVSVLRKLLPYSFFRQAECSEASCGP
jgi:hypothetical protein